MRPRSPVVTCVTSVRPVADHWIRIAQTADSVGCPVVSVVEIKTMGIGIVLYGLVIVCGLLIAKGK
jgi:hypothetical protein